MTRALRVMLSLLAFSSSAAFSQKTRDCIEFGDSKSTVDDILGIPGVYDTGFDFSITHVENNLASIAGEWSSQQYRYVFHYIRPDKTWMFLGFERRFVDGRYSMLLARSNNAQDYFCDKTTDSSSSVLRKGGHDYMGRVVWDWYVFAPRDPFSIRIETKGNLGGGRGWSGGCGSRGGPGWRKPNGKCASWSD